MFIDMTFQLMHGLRCMSRYVHITLIYIYSMVIGNDLLHCIYAQVHRMKWMLVHGKISIVFGVDVGFGLGIKS